VLYENNKHEWRLSDTILSIKSDEQIIMQRTLLIKTTQKIRLLVRIFKKYYPSDHLRVFRELSSLMISNISKRYGCIFCYGNCVWYNDLIEALPTAKEIYVNQIYKRKLTDVRTIVDIGANIGLSTLWFKKAYPEASIIAVEPNTQAYEKLCRNISFNAADPVVCLHCAVAKKGGMVTLFTSNTSTVITSCSTELTRRFSFKHNKIKPFRIESITLSEIIKLYGQIDILKIDIEGGEYELESSLLLNADSIKTFVLELHRISSYDSFAFLSRLSKRYTIAVDSLPSNTIDERDAFLENPSTSHNNLLIYGISKTIS
jgi:FkbM family methyltransferase